MNNNDLTYKAIENRLKSCASSYLYFDVPPSTRNNEDSEVRASQSSNDKKADYQPVGETDAKTSRFAVEIAASKNKNV